MKVNYLDNQRQHMEESINEVKEDLNAKGTPMCFMMITIYKSEEFKDGLDIKRFWSGDASYLEKIALLEHLKLDIYNNS